MSQETFSGHGSAMAQAYNHMIMPLANSRDRYTQVVWGLRDFEHRFGRPPEGHVAAGDRGGPGDPGVHGGLGSAFHHPGPPSGSPGAPEGAAPVAGRQRPAHRPHPAYSLKLPSGQKIALFFYDGPISKAVAFEDLLDRGENLAHRLAGAFSEDRKWPQLVHIATDGETYGHHRRHGDMALAYALDYIDLGKPGPPDQLRGISGQAPAHL